MFKERSNVYMDDAEEKSIMEIIEDMGIYATMDHSKSRSRICKAMLSAQVCETELKTGQTILQDYTGFSETVCEQRATSHLVFKRSKYACLWRST